MIPDEFQCTVCAGMEYSERDEEEDVIKTLSMKPQRALGRVVVNL